MARGKKVATLTPEEKLEQALVPVEEQPYKVPENWCWVRLDNISQIIMGQSPSGAATTDDDSYIPLIGGAADMGNLYPNVSRYTMVPTKISTPNDLILCIRATLGKPVFSDGEYCLGRGVAAIRPNFGIREFYRYYFLTFERYLYDNATGSTFVQVSSAVLQKMPVPLSPLPEQQRIVDRIESLFAKLDEAKEKAQAVVDGFELRKSAILHQAFTGELTKGWRQKHGVGMESWKIFLLKECCQIGSGGTPSRKHPEYYNGHIPWIKTGEINWNTIESADESVSDEAIESSSAKIYQPGAVLVAMYGMGVTRGRAAVLAVPATTNQAVCVLQPNDYLLNRYLFYYFMCNYWTVREQSVGGNQLNLSATIIGKFQIAISQLDEQAEIVRILDDLLSKEQQAKNAAEAVLAQIDTMKKAILARAFRGELGTNDPTEEWAGELLNVVL